MADKEEGPLTGVYFNWEWGSWSQKKLGMTVNWYSHGKTSIKTGEDFHERAEAAFNLVRDFFAGKNADPGLRPAGIRALIRRQIDRNKSRGDASENDELVAMLNATAEPDAPKPHYVLSQVQMTELQKMLRDEVIEECAGIALKRTCIPPDAKNPTRDAAVIFGEQLADLLRSKKIGELDLRYGDRCSRCGAASGIDTCPNVGNGKCPIHVVKLPKNYYETRKPK